MWEQLGMGWVGLSGGLCPSLLFAPTRKADVGAWMWLHLQRFQEELAQLRAAPSSAIPVPARAVLTVPVGSARSSPSHPVLEESSVMPPWNCASPQAPSLPRAHPGTSGWAGMWVPAVPGGGDRIDLCPQHSSADSFGISRWEDKREQPRVSRGLCHTWQVHLALQGLFPPSSLPFFLPSCCFSLRPEQTGRSLPNLVNELGDKPCSLITGDRWPGEIPGGCSPARGSSQGAAAHRLCSSTPQGLAAALPNLPGMWLDPWWDHSPHGDTACWLWALFPVWNPQHLPIILSVLTQKFCVFSWEKKSPKPSFPSFFSLAVLTWVQHRGSGSIPAWHRDTHPSAGALSTTEQGFSTVGGVPAPHFWVAGGCGVLAGTGQAPAALFLSPCLERFSLYQRLRVFSAGD